MRDDTHAGVPLVAFEPSCVSIFRDEMPNLLVGDEDGARLRQRTKTPGGPTASFLEPGYVPEAEASKMDS
jgi:hypothetical protein